MVQLGIVARQLSDELCAILHLHQGASAGALNQFQNIRFSVNFIIMCDELCNVRLKIFQMALFTAGPQRLFGGAALWQTRLVPARIAEIFPIGFRAGSLLDLPERFFIQKPDVRIEFLETLHQLLDLFHCFHDVFHTP